MAYKVIVPCVITKKEDKSDLYLYEGAVLPDFVSDAEVKRLLEDKFIESLDGEPAKAAAKKSGPSAPSN